MPATIFQVPKIILFFQCTVHCAISVLIKSVIWCYYDDFIAINRITTCDVNQMKMQQFNGQQIKNCGKFSCHRELLDTVPWQIARCVALRSLCVSFSYDPFSRQTFNIRCRWKLNNNRREENNCDLIWNLRVCEEKRKPLHWTPLYL